MTVFYVVGLAMCAFESLPFPGLCVVRTFYNKKKGFENVWIFVKCREKDSTCHLAPYSFCGSSYSLLIRDV